MIENNNKTNKKHVAVIMYNVIGAFTGTLEIHKEFNTNIDYSKDIKNKLNTKLDEINLPEKIDKTIKGCVSVVQDISHVFLQCGYLHLFNQEGVNEFNDFVKMCEELGCITMFHPFTNLKEVRNEDGYVTLKRAE